MRKRIGALGLAAVLLLAMICPALAAGTTFVVKGPDQAPRKGETFTVTVELKNNPGFNAIQFTLAYDRDKMTCTKAVRGSLIAETLFATNPSAPEGAVVTAATLDTVSEDGVVGQFTFTADNDLDDIEFGLEVVSFVDAQRAAIPYQVDMNGMDAKDDFVDHRPGSVSLPEREPVIEQEPASQPEPESDSQAEPVVEPGPQQESASEPVQEITFTDTKGHWGESYIAKAAELGLFKGYPDGSFQPNLNVTRAQYVTVLYRMAGSPAVSSEAPFTDIAKQSQEFRTAIAWGYEKGYLNGRGEGIFDPNGPVTRQEAMKILFGYDGGVSGMEVMFTAIYDKGFMDSDQIASWGKAAMYWGVYKSLITGTSETTLSPRGTATRAQLAKILTGYYDLQNQ